MRCSVGSVLGLSCCSQSIRICSGMAAATPSRMPGTTPGRCKPWLGHKNIRYTELAPHRADVARLNGVLETSHDALAHLQKIYSDPNAPISAVLKAAGLAVGFERARPPQLSANIKVERIF